MIYGYCRISTSRQNILRQERNILEKYPKAQIYKEIYTGTKTVGRTAFNKLITKAKAGDTIVFDSVSRMSRNAEEGIAQYMELFEKGVNLEFLKEPHINTEVYKEAIKCGVELTGTDVDDILIGVNKYMIRLAKNQIRLAFEQAEKEVNDLKQRTKEGIQTARNEGKQIGILKGQKLVTKKSENTKSIILKHSKDFGGTLNDIEVIKLCGISRNSYYKYKKELVNDVREDNLKI